MLFAGSAMAQYAPTFYNFNVTAGKATTTAIHARGFDRYVELSAGTKDYMETRLQIRFSNTLDSAKVQGLRDSTISGVSPWEDIVVNFPLVTRLDNWSAGRTDTNVVWMTPVTTGVANYSGPHPGSTGIFTIPPGYSKVRVCTGKNDTGIVYIRQTLIPRR
jgi:hypothetical protein